MKWVPENRTAAFVLRSEWRKLARFVNSLVLQPGHGVNISHDPSGQTVSVDDKGRRFPPRAWCGKVISHAYGASALNIAVVRPCLGTSGTGDRAYPAPTVDSAATYDVSGVILISPLSLVNRYVVVMPIDGKPDGRRWEAVPRSTVDGLYQCED